MKMTNLIKSSKNLHNAFRLKSKLSKGKWENYYTKEELAKPEEERKSKVRKVKKSMVGKNPLKERFKQIRELQKRLKKLTKHDEKELRKDLKTIIDEERDLRFFIKKAMKKENKDEEGRLCELLETKTEKEKSKREKLRKAESTEKESIREQLRELTSIAT